MDEADPRAKLEPFQALIGTWATEATHPAVETVTFERLEGGQAAIQLGWLGRANRTHDRR
jgi:hypothetical protein